MSNKRKPTGPARPARDGAALDRNLLAPTLVLDAALPGPADLPDIPPVAPAAEVVAARITGHTGMEAHAHRMVAAGVEHRDVFRAMNATRDRTQALAHLLGAVDAVLAGAPLGALATARDRLVAQAEVAR